MVLKTILGTVGAPLLFTKSSTSAVLFGGKKFMRKLMMLCIFFMPAGTVLADFAAFLDLDRAGFIEGHFELFTSPSASSQILTNDVNELTLDGNDLFLDHVIDQPSPATLTFDVTISASSGSTLFNNLSEPGDAVFFGFEELELGGSYSFAGMTVMVGKGTSLTALSNDSLFFGGDGSLGDPMFFDFLFEGADVAAFDGADTLTMSAQFSSTSAVPVPAAVWLFGSGLLGLAGVARRKARA